jgi:hypothetical protein
VQGGTKLGASRWTSNRVADNADQRRQRFTGRRELLPETINATAGLVSDKSAGLTW